MTGVLALFVPPAVLAVAAVLGLRQHGALADPAILAAVLVIGWLALTAYLALAAIRRLAEITFGVLDTETTGLDPRAGHRVVSVAVVLLDRGRVRVQESFDALVNPGRPIPALSQRFHGITDAMVANAPPIGEVLTAVDRFLADAPSRATR